MPLPLLYPLWAVSMVLWWSYPSGVARVTTNASGEFWWDVAAVIAACAAWAYWFWWIAFASGARAK